MNLRNILHKIFAAVEAKPVVGGLDISDSALRFVSSASSFAASTRLLPGIVTDGRIQDEAAFLAALAELRRNILGRRSQTGARINTVISLSSTHVYSQVFSLPFLEGENLDKAVELNLQMALPGGTPLYSGWEIINSQSDTGKIDILSAFLERGTADDVVRLLRKANFSVMAIESRGLSLARVLKNAPGFDPRSPSLLISADTSGLDVLVVKGGSMRFEYFNSWKDLQAGDKDISLESFRNLILRSSSQVVNFYGAHWKEPLGDVFVASTGLKEEIMAAAASVFTGKVRELVAPISPPVTAEWFVALGGALRGRLPRRSDTEISLLGVDARDKYHQEQVEHFLSFWRVLAPVSLTVLLLIYFGAWAIMGSIKSSIEAQAALKLSPEQAREIDSLKAEAASFNQLVSTLETATRSGSPKAPLLGKLLEITSRRGIIVNRFALGTLGTPITMTGSARSEEDIRAFRNELSITQGIKDVVLPITDIKKEGGSYTFSVTFTASS